MAPFLTFLKQTDEYDEEYDEEDEAGEKKDGETAAGDDEYY